MGRIFLKVFGVFLVLFGFLMLLGTSLQAVKPFQLFPYLCSIVFGALIFKYEVILGYSSKSTGRSSKRIHVLALLSFLLGLAGIFGIPIFSLSAFICGIIFIIMNKRNGNVFRGNSAAVIGIIISSIWLFFFSIPLFYSPQMHYDYGETYLAAGKYDQAIVELDKTIKQEPQFHDVYSLRALAYARKGDYDSAVADYTKGIESFGDSDPFFKHKKAEAVLGRAKVYFLKQEYEKAWEDVRKAESLGADIDAEFIEYLRKASGRDK